ncbi:hypothetical protein AtDm6_2936 [Acetobacter tropicalis]|uniref:Uncharacterized protein n=1 Tax=Acetobacter tropicalis TaxID=104102 RepID=A0A094YH16_9PROT|nr:hypothetical protein AtDm6_2936 [Acetobacter tropicalis]
MLISGRISVTINSDDCNFYGKKPEHQEIEKLLISKVLIFKERW